MADGISSAAFDVARHLDPAGASKKLGDIFDSILLIGIHRPEREPGFFLVVLPIGDAWNEHIGSNLDDGANRPLGANHGCDVQMRHAIL